MVGSFGPDRHVLALRRLILEYADRHNVDSAVLMQVCGEVVALTAATLDLHTPRRERGTLDDQLESFVAVVKQRHPQIVSELLARRH